MVTLTKFLVTVTFAVVFVLGSAFISGEKQRNIPELEDLDNYQNKKNAPTKDSNIIYSEEGEVRNPQESLDEENSDHLWDDVIDDEESEDTLLPNFVGKNTLSKNTTNKR